MEARPADVAEDLLWEVRDYIGVMTFNRPERMNAISKSMLRSLVKTIDAAQRDRRVRVVVITGAGRGFCSGLDLKDQEKEPGLDQSEGPGYFDLRGAPVMALYEFDKPLIGCVNGPAMGYGLDLALCCDLRVMSTSAILGPIFTKLGVLPDGGGTWLLPRLVGYTKAAEIAMTGRTLDAERSMSLGLVNEICEPDLALSRAMDLAGEIASNAPLAVQATKRLLRLSSQESFEAHLDHLAAKLVPLFGSDDFREGLAARAERRAPRFAGR